MIKRSRRKTDLNDMIWMYLNDIFLIISLMLFLQFFFQLDLSFSEAMLYFRNILRESLKKKISKDMKELEKYLDEMIKEEDKKNNKGGE